MTTEQLQTEVATVRRGLDACITAVQTMREHQAMLSATLVELHEALRLLEQQVRVIRAERLQ